MKNRSAALTLWANRLLMLTVVGLACAMPKLLPWYNRFRPLEWDTNMALLIAFYLCVPIALYALYNLEKLLRNILQEEVFTRENVSRIRIVRWCCGGISLICLPASICYLPLLFVVLIMAFLCLVVSVVANVMDAAVSLQEESLTSSFRK